MPLLNIVYLSKTKIGIYYPQIPHAWRNEPSAKIGFNIGVVSAEYSTKSPEVDDDIQKMKRIVAYLESEGEIGTIENPKSWFKGEVRAGSIVEGGQIIFGAVADSPSGEVAICLNASTKHMIGDDYKEVEEGKYFDREVGPTRSRLFFTNSNTVDFAERLFSVYYAKRKLTQSKFETSEKNRKEVKRAMLDSDERSAFNRWRIFNPLIALLCPRGEEGLYSNHWKRNILCGIVSIVFVAPLLSLLMGIRGYRAKKRAIKKLGAVEQGLSDKERDLLESIASVVRSVGPYQAYQFVAVTLFEGEIEGRHVILGSPLYLALGK